jgi:hypothetical protein
MPKNRVTKKPTSKNPKLRLNKDSLQPVSEAALIDITAAQSANTCRPCPWPSTRSASPDCWGPPKCTWNCY